MKHKTLHTTLEQDKSLKNISYVWNAIDQNQKIANPKMFEMIGADNALLFQNRGKAPPGRARSPGLGRGHPPENKGDPPDQPRSPVASPLSFEREGMGVSQKIKHQFQKLIQFQNFSQLNLLS